MKLLCVNNKPIPGCTNDSRVLALIQEFEEYEGEMADAIDINENPVTAWHIPSIDRRFHINRFIPLSDELDEVHEEELVFAL